jgi:PKD repeat protein
MQHRFGRASRLGSPQGRIPRWTLGIGLAAGLLLAVPASGVAASDALDQSLPAGTVPTQINSNKLMAQTFTAGTSGRIDKLSLALESHSNLVTGWLEIRTVTPSDPTGQPNGGTLWPTTLTPIQFTFPFGNPYHDFTISPAFPITAGTTYAIVWTTKVGSAYWWGTTYSSYASGQQWVSCQGCAWSANPNRDFAFQTWVGTAAASQPPAVAADHPSVSVNEGTAAGNTGTFSDPDGDAVTLSASSGSLTKSGTANGSWSWSALASDEAGARTITITADDGHGVTSTTSFPVTVSGAAPLASAAGPASGPEGTAVSLTGGATSPSVEDNTVGFAYGWNVTKNGSPYAAGAGGHWHFTPNDNGTYVATVKATDDGAMSDSASTTINVTNVAPTAIILKAGYTTSLVVTPEESLDFTSTSTDPGTADTHTYQWAFGDGSTSSSQNTTHFYGSAGTFHVTLTVRDNDGGTGTDTASVLVQSPQDALSTIAGTVNGITTLTKGQKTSLSAKLQAAADAAARGNNTASHNQMSAFLSEVRAYVKTGKITADQQSALTDAIHAVEAALGTYNRMLQWWPLEP